MAATATELNKLSLSDLTDKNQELVKSVKELRDLSSRDPEQDAQMDDLLLEIEQVQDAINEKKIDDRNRRAERALKFDDKPAPRKAGGNDPANTFASFGERLSAVYKFRATGQVDRRLFNAALGAQENQPSDGGFLVGSDAEFSLQDKVYGSPILQYIPRTPISANSNMLKLKLLKENSRADGSRQGGVQAYWEGEAQSATATLRQYEELEMTLRKLMALSYATSEMLEDYSALESETSQGYVDEMTFKLENAVINGDGVGKPLGILNSTAKVTVSAEAGQTSADPLMYENITKMWSRLHPRSQMSAVWLVDQSLIPYLFTMGIANGTAGTPVYLPPGGASGSPYGTLFGRPVIFTEHTQAANTEGDIILWDPQSYRIIEKGGIKGASSVHVAFLTDETAFRFTYRVNGQPKWKSALTPKNGGSTLSTIVTLATRT